MILRGLLRPRRDLSEDQAAAVGLAQQQFGIRAIGRIGRQVAGQLLGDERDGAERRAQFMGGGGGEGPHRGDALFPVERRLHRHQRIGHPARFLSHLEHIDGDEHGRERQRDGKAEDEDRRQIEARLRPGQRQMEEGQDVDAGDGKRGEAQRAAKAQAPPRRP